MLNDATSLAVHTDVADETARQTDTQTIFGTDTVCLFSVAQSRPN